MKALKNSLLIVLLFFTMIIFSGPSASYGLPVLDNYAEHSLGNLDARISHYEYKEGLERGTIGQELNYDIDEHNDIQVELIENEIEEDNNPRTNFFSSKKRYINLFDNGSDSFSYSHQVPPNVNPDVTSSPYFNDFDFRTNIIEIDFTLKGWSDSKSNMFEVFIQQDGVDIASLGSLSFKKEKKDKFEYKLDFSQHSEAIGGFGIADEIYYALGDSDGLFDITIRDISGSGNFHITHSMLELEQLSAPAAIPEPATIVLLLTGCLALFIVSVIKKSSKRCI